MWKTTPFANLIDNKFDRTVTFYSVNRDNATSDIVPSGGVFDPGTIKFVVNVTWKDTDMWILTRPMRAGDIPEVYKFKEKSTFGVMEGEITIVESGGIKPTSYLHEWTDIGNPPEWFVNEQAKLKSAIATNTR